MHSKALLPTGFYDLLPPYAAFEAHLLRHAMLCFQNFGYARVSPPLVEFEESLLGEHSKMDPITFRLLDAASQRLMGVRPDITMQIGRIALTRLQDVPRPLRLCYSGSILQTRGGATNPARQHTQAGLELIGPDSAGADAEALIVAITSLQQLGVKRISVDLNLPRLTGMLLDDYDIPLPERADVLDSLTHKVITPLERLDERLLQTLRLLTENVGPAKAVLPKILSLQLPKAAEELCQRLADVVERVQQACPDVSLTLDATEIRGYDYHTGISFALFASGIEGEIGRGGRYVVAFDQQTQATGFTIYISHLLHILTPPPQPDRVLISADCPHDAALALQQQGYQTVRDIESGDELRNKAGLQQLARQLNCHYLWTEGRLQPLPAQPTPTE